jgi:HPt (histidine-containing phosphotransfer) domain-containing protein
VAPAEAALEALAGEFAGWMHAECERLEAARREVRREGMTKKAHNDLFRTAHDIKGEAATFGYQAVAPVAESRCRLFEHTPEIKRIPFALVEQHVDAVRAIARKHARVDRAGTASALTRRLRDVTDEVPRAENIDRPDYQESVFAPPLVPGGAGAWAAILRVPAGAKRQGPNQKSGVREYGCRTEARRRRIAARRQKLRPPARRRTGAPPRARLRWRSAATA